MMTESSGLVITAMVLGICSLVFSMVPILGLALGLTALILGIMGYKKQVGKNMAIAGIITGGIGILLGLAFIVLFFGYFGFWNSHTLLPEKCFVGPGFGCTGQELSVEEGVIKARIINNYGSEITNVSFTVTGSNPEGIEYIYGCDGCTWEANAIKEIVFDAYMVDPEIHERASVVFTLKFKPANSEYVRTAEGEIAVGVRVKD